MSRSHNTTNAKKHKDHFNIGSDNNYEQADNEINNQDASLIYF
jgi:hypothetical protein